VGVGKPSSMARNRGFRRKGSQCGEARSHRMCESYSFHARSEYKFFLSPVARSVAAGPLCVTVG
jgi:hypothetical protein